MERKQIVNIKKIAYTKLRKLEVFTLYSEVMDIVGKYDTKAMHIEATCHVLAGMQAKAELLDVSDKDFGAHLLTPVVGELHERRLKLASFITNHIRALERVAFEDTIHLVDTAKAEVTRHLNYLRENDRDDVTQLIIQFFATLKEKPEVESALHELGFKFYLDHLQDAHNAYMKAYGERREQQSAQRKGSTLPVQREIQRALAILFEQVDSYQHTYLSIDYTALILELNYVITSYTKQIKTRDTQRKNRKLRAQEKAEGIESASQENVEVEEVEKNHSATVSETAEAKTTTVVTEKQQKTSPTATNRAKGKGKPITGLLDILKKPKNADGEKDNDKDLPLESGD